MDTFHSITLRHNTRFAQEGSSVDCMSETLLSHDLQENAFLDPWYSHEEGYPSLGSPALFNHIGPIFVEEETQHAPQHPHSLGHDDLYLSSPLSGSPFKRPTNLPRLCDSPFMGSDLSARSPLSRILTGSHDACCRPQPPSPPLDTPELIQRTLPDTQTSEPLSPPLTSPVDLLDLPSLSSFDSPREDLLDFGPERRVLDNDGMLDPLFEDSTMDWSNGVDGERDYTQDLRTPPDCTKQRGNSLDSSQIHSYDFLAPRSLQPRRRSFTTPPDFASSSPQLDDLWDTPNQMDIDEDVDGPPHSPRSPSLSLHLSGFDDVDMSSIDPEAPSHLLSASPQPPPPLALFDEPSYTDGCDFVPSSPHSPHMQLLPSDEDDALLMMGLVSEPAAATVTAAAAAGTATIAPALLGLPLAADVGVGGLGLDVDAGLDRSPSPSDYEVQLLEGYGDAAASELPEDEFRQLRVQYEDLRHLEAALKEREGVLERRVKDISVLLKPERASEDAAVMRARRQEYRAATELRAETRRARKEEKHRLRELGALLDLKLDTRVFHGKGSLRSVAHLVADMVFKRHDRSRSLANRKTAAAPQTSSCFLSSPLRSSISFEDLASGEDPDDSM
ncbi:hypothetical protein PHLGIDRAFT_129404 [Phlebiopsis gigantea 11061_1 CR5-6]|uniref:Uncharacterized protein n=1 Tax=Phlebiopsis gigantea (strain 11061_1 CR5-6) TaxID=745531 RepID=A0A0C3S798_PHLG1|nr:hypothetical protein PHLGIDRAFT_129404 [Phlebiopsis gigantea 11061_1 CR5-6]